MELAHGATNLFMFLARASEKITMKYPYSLVLLLVLSSPCFAYIDPGVGGFLWQGFIAMTLGIGFQIYQFFRGKKETHGSDSTTQSETD